MNDFKIILSAVRRAIEAITTPLQNHEALLQSSIDTLSYNVVEIERAMLALKNKRAASNRELENCRIQLHTYTRQARSDAASGNLDGALQILLERRQYLQASAAIKERNRAIDGALEQLVERRQRMNDALEHLKLQVRGRRVRNDGQCDDDVRTSVDARELARLLECGVADLDAALMIQKHDAQRIKNALSVEERKSLEQELSDLMNEKADPNF